MYRLEDVDFMREALRLAAEGTGLASPNPRVGGVVVKDGHIVGRGCHRYEQVTHAEVLALAEAGEAARGATLYLNLEPCSHTGRTPPCADAVIAAGIARVVAAMPDPNPQVAGSGLRRLSEAGISVDTGCLEREARRLNQDFAKWIRTSLPFVTLKSAVSLDGKIAPPPLSRTDAAPSWISSTPSRERVQQLRHAADAVLTGIGTILADNPKLTDRTKLPRRRPLLRVVLDRDLQLPLDSQLVQSARRHPEVVVFHASSDASKVQTLEKKGVRCQPVPATEGGLDLSTVLKQLGEEDVIAVLLEAGARLNGAMLAGGHVDKLILFQAPKLLGEGAVPFANGITDALPRLLTGGLSGEAVGPDLMIEADMAD